MFLESLSVCPFFFSLSKIRKWREEVKRTRKSQKWREGATKKTQYIFCTELRRAVESGGSKFSINRIAHRCHHFALVTPPTNSRLSALLLSLIIIHTMAAPQVDGCYPRVNAGMVSTGQFTGMLVSIVGRVQSGGSAEQATLQSSDQTSITLSTADMEGGLFQHDPEMVIEIIGAVQDESTITVSVVRCRPRLDEWSGLCVFRMPIS
jgi:hypothetical protein